MEGERTYTAKSGNTCTCLIETKGDNTGVSALWKREPSEADKQEVMQFIHDELEAEGVPVGDMRNSVQGKGRAGKARSIEAVRRFLETGDPGVPTTPFDPTKNL